MSLRDLADVIGCSHTYVSNLEKGRSRANLPILVVLAFVLELDLCELCNHYGVKVDEDTMNCILGHIEGPKDLKE
jgi:transcriptional regulator with XRE-family HTH domain